MHVEIPCKSVHRAKRFYGVVFGWKFQDVPDMEDTLFSPASPPGGGLFVPREGQPTGVVNYLLADSIGETSKRIEEEGGRILVPESEVPGHGWYAIFQTPRGTPCPSGRGTRRRGRPLAARRSSTGSTPS